MRALLNLLLSLAVVVSCSAGPITNEPPSENIQGWSADWLIGRTLSLQSETRVSVMRFGSSGFVAVTAGQRGGPLTGPLLPWHIQDGRLVVGGSSYEFVSTSGNVITVRVDGNEARYELSK